MREADLVRTAATDPSFYRSIPTEDAKAGNLGMPFTETEDEEEWVGWVNTAEVEAETPAAARAPPD